jgi:hypothetical protein
LEFEERFVTFERSDRRYRLYEGLKRLIEDARRSGIVRRLFVGGSFVTSKAQPNDCDCLLAFDPGVVSRNLPPFQYNLVTARSRRIYGGDIFAAADSSELFREYLGFFQLTDDKTPKGIVEIEL